MVLGLGARILDLSVDLSAAVAHDCPPISHYRIVLRERAWLRRLCVKPGAQVAADEVLAQFSTDPDEPLDGEPGRAVRVSIAGILDQSDWWSADGP